MRQRIKVKHKVEIPTEEPNNISKIDGSCRTCRFCEIITGTDRKLKPDYYPCRYHNLLCIEVVEDPNTDACDKFQR